MASGEALLAYDFVDDVMVSASGDGVMTDALWDDYLRAVDAYLVDRPAARNIVITGDTKVGAGQRQRLSDTIRRRSPKPGPTVVITSSVVARGIIVALNWLLKRDVKTFPPARLTEALDDVGIPGPQRARIEARVRAVALRAGVRGLEAPGGEAKPA